MGGEWLFSIRKSKDGTELDLDKYQKMLIEIRSEYESKCDYFENLSRCEYSPYARIYGGYGAYAWWCDNNLPPWNNIFAIFEYRCTRHSRSSGIHNHSISDSADSQTNRDGPSTAVWHLFWNPTIVEPFPDGYSTVHARCGPPWFKNISHEIQSKIVRAFPQHFHLYWGDGVSGHDFTIDSDSASFI